MVLDLGGDTHSKLLAASLWLLYLSFLKYMIKGKKTKRKSERPKKKKVS